MKTGDEIAPPGGYVGGLQMQTDLAIGPARDVWVMNNWQDSTVASVNLLKRCPRVAAGRVWWCSSGWPNP